MLQTVAEKPVPIRLAQRYPNGCMLSYSARALAHGETFVRVLVNQEFEIGIQLSVMAPFLEGMTVGRVYSVKRSEKQPGFFEVMLRIGEDSISSVLLNANIESGESRKGQSKIGGESKGADNASAPSPSGKAHSQVPDMAVEAAEKLAHELREYPGRTFSRTLNGIPSELRPMSLLVVVAAAVHLLQEKGHVVARHLLDNARGRGAQNAGETQQAGRDLK